MKESDTPHTSTPIPAESTISGNTWTVGKLRTLAARAGFDDFLLALIGMIFLAWLWPAPGIGEGPFSLANLANYGVSVIFFFYGLKLSPQKLQVGLSNWRLHLAVQLATFVLFPAIVLLGQYFFITAERQLLWLGAFYLAALPSTVSSSVVMVSIAGGNLPAAIFNASISSLVGVFITPLWMGLFFSGSSDTYDLNSVIGKLTLQVLAPVLLGILLHSRWGAFAERYRKGLRYFDQTIILIIVYTAFCESFARQLFKGVGLWDIVQLSLLMIGLFFLVYGIIHLISRLMRFSREDRITALFCGSKKSLVQGTVMAKVLFPGVQAIGIILLPIMLYHALQLVVVSILAQRMATRSQPKTTSM